MTFARRVDRNHGDVVHWLRDLGWKVLDIHGQCGAVDLICWHPGRQALRLVEVKDGKAGYTDAQRDLLADGWPIATIRTMQDAIGL